MGRIYSLFVCCALGVVIFSAPSVAENKPGGTYLESCRACSLSGSILTCDSCKDGFGGFSKNPSLDINACKPEHRNMICNNHGELSCPGPC